MPTFQRQGLTYHYQVAGSSGPDLMLLHGFAGSHATWEPLLPALASRFSLLLLDLPGHGRTDAPQSPERASMPRVGDDIVALLEDLHIRRSYVAGYSMGGRLALYLLVTFPALFTAALLESASPGLSSEAAKRDRRARDERLALRIEQHGVPAFVDSWEALPLFATQRLLPSSVRQRQRAQRMQNDVAGLAASLRAMGTGVQPNLWPLLPSIAQPVCLVAGSLDEKYVDIAKQMAAGIPHATLSLADNCGHNVHLERPDWFAGTVIGSFLGTERGR